MNNTIVGMGEVLWDMLPEGKQLGGAPANFAYHASQFGFDSRVISAVGDDRLGDEILESFDDKQLKYFIQRVPYPTGTVQVQPDENGIPGYEIKEKAMELHKALVEAAAEHDETLMEKFFESESLTEDEMREGIRKGLAARGMFPVFCVCSV